MINKAVVPTLLVLLIWFLGLYLFISAGSTCDVVGKPCINPFISVGQAVLILAPLVGGLYIYLVSKDLKFVVVFCGIFYVLLLVLARFLF